MVECVSCGRPTDGTVCHPCASRAASAAEIRAAIEAISAAVDAAYAVYADAISAAIRLLPGGTVSRPLADHDAALADEVRRLRAHHEHCAWGACDGCEDVALERDAAQADLERLRVRVAELEQALAERMGATDG